MSAKSVPDSSDDGLTEGERLFVAEYLIDRNATEAYIRANPGTKRNTAGTAGYKLLKKDEVKAAVRRAIREQELRTQATADNVIREIARIAFCDPGRAMDLSQGEPVPLPPRQIPFEVRRAIQSIKVKRRKLKNEYQEDYEVEETEYKFYDKNTALEKLCKHLNLYQELPQWEVILALLPEADRERLRQEFGRSVSKPQPELPPPDSTDDVR